MLKPCRRRAEDKVGSTLNVAVLEIDTCTGHAGIHRILMSQETAVYKSQTIALCMNSHSLSQTSGIILYRKVFEGDIIGIDPNCKRAERSQLGPIAHSHQLLAGLSRPETGIHDDIGMVVIGDDGLVAVFTT